MGAGRAAHFENLRLPPDMDFSEVTALSFEARQKLKQHRPETLGMASRISGITPASISLLMVYLKKRKWKEGAALIGNGSDQGELAAKAGE